MGTVYLGCEEGGRLVALKPGAPAAAGRRGRRRAQPAQGARFQREVSAMARPRTRNVVAIRALGEQ
jgi:hypothetical protein